MIPGSVLGRTDFVLTDQLSIPWSVWVCLATAEGKVRMGVANIAHLPLPSNPIHQVYVNHLIQLICIKRAVSNYNGYIEPLQSLAVLT